MKIKPSRGFGSFFYLINNPHNLESRIELSFFKKKIRIFHGLYTDFDVEFMTGPIKIIRVVH